MTITSPAGRKKNIKVGDTITVVSDLFGKTRIKVASANAKSVMGYPVNKSAVSPKTGLPIQGGVVVGPREIRKGFRR